MHCSGNQSVIASVHIFDTIAASMRAPNKIFFVEMFPHFEIYFPPQPKNWHNRTTVLFTKYICNTKNHFPPEPKN